MITFVIFTLTFLLIALLLRLGWEPGRSVKGVFSRPKREEILELRPETYREVQNALPETTSDQEQTFQNHDGIPLQFREAALKREAELLHRIDTLEKESRTQRHSWLPTISWIAANTILLFGTIGGTLLLILIIAFVSPIERLKALFDSDTYWGSGLPECDSSYAAEQTRKKFVEIPLVAITKSFPEEVVDAREVSRTEQKRDCRGVIRTKNGKSVDVKFTFESSNKSGEFFYSLEIADPRDLPPTFAPAQNSEAIVNELAREHEQRMKQREDELSDQRFKDLRDRPW